MKPKEYIGYWKNKYQTEEDPDLRAGYFRQWLGARDMWKLMRAKDNEWRDRNREKLREYNREYARVRRAKQKEMKEDIDKISQMN